MDASARHPERQPDDAIALLKRASETIKVKQYDEALQLLNSAIEADASLSEAYRQRASVLRQLCRYLSDESIFRFLIFAKSLHFRNINIQTIGIHGLKL